MIVTTASGAKRLGGSARGLEPWESTTLEAPGKEPLEITATPCRHGPPGFGPIVGDVIGFLLRTASGCRATPSSTTACATVADRLNIDVAVIHLGGVQFPVTGPLRFTMTASDAVELWI